MALEREPTRRATPAGYPSLAEVRTDRRRFLRLLGRGALGAAVVGLAACDGADEVGGSGPDLVSDVVPRDVPEPPPDGMPPIPDVPGPDIAGPEPDVPGGLDVGGPDLPPEPPIGGEDVRYPDLVDVDPRDVPEPVPDGMPPLPEEP